MDPIKVAVLDDHQLTLDGVVSRLKDTPSIELVFTASYASELETLLAKTPVNVLILDINVPTSPDNVNAYPILHVIPRLIQNYPDISVLVLSMYKERTLIQAVLEAGANGYLMKDDNALLRELGSIVRTVAGGGLYLSPQAAHQLSKQIARDPDVHLTPRQLEVLSLCVAYPDASTAELAKLMGVSNSTVRNLLSGSYVRLGVRNKASAISKARKLGLLGNESGATHP